MQDIQDKRRNVNRLMFEFREADPNSISPNERQPHLYCHRLGKFTARGLEIIKLAVSQQHEQALKEEASNTPNSSSNVLASIYTPDSRTPTELDPYDPKHYDASLREVKEVE